MGLANRLERVTRRHPGSLMQKTLQAMHETVTPGAAPLEEKEPPNFFLYLQRTLANHGKGDPRAEKELTSLALAVDRILEGRLEEALDTSARRFKRGEAQDSGALRPELAARLETIPGAQISSLSREEKEEVTDLDRKLQRYLDAPRGRSPHR